MKFSTYKKYLLAGAMMALVLLMPFSSAHAQSNTQLASPNLYSCLSDAPTCGVYLAALTANGIVSLFVTLGAFLVRLGLQFNDNIFNSPAVLTGFSVSLAIANLGFVFGIIIIALATIIRNQTYGMKQLLWKLVVMAIVVNFGLVICAPIVGFAGSMSNYFVNATAGNTSSFSGTVDGYESFAVTMTQAFAPQSVITPDTSFTTKCNAATGGLSTLCSLANGIINVAQPSDSFFQQVIALIFGIVFSGMTAITFLCLAVLLIVRYLMLSGLLIVLPLAWLTFIFPKFNSNFSKWWTEFIKWTFFPPLALFFIYLAFITAANTGASSGASGNTTTGSAYLNQAAGLPAASSNGPEAGLVYQIGLAGPIQQAADEVLLVGLTFMGLMFASSLAGKAGSTVVGVAKSGTKFVGGYIGKQTKKGARASFNAVGGRDAVAAMRSGKVQAPSILKKIPIVGGAVHGAANWAVTRGTSLAGRAIEPHLNNSELVKAQEKNVPESLKQREEDLAGNMNMETVYAYIKKGVAEHDLTMDTMIGKQKYKDFVLTHETEFKNYGQGKTESDGAKVIGANRKTLEASAKVENLASAGQDTSAALKELNTATKEFVATLKKGDMPKMNSDTIFKDDKSETAKALSRALLDVGPHLVSSMLPNMKAKSLKNFDKMYKDAYREEAFRIATDTSLNSDEKDKEQKRLGSNRDTLEKALGNNALFTPTQANTPDAPAAPAAPAPTPPPAH